jgi:transcription initiation factor TFIIB
MICPECGGVINEDEDTGEYYCMRCGLVLGERIPTSEPTPHELFGEDRRFGPKLTKLLHDNGLGTVIKPSRSAGRVYKVESKREKRILRRLLSEVMWVSSRLGVSKEVGERAAMLCRMAISKGVQRRGARALAASAIYLSLKEMGHPRSMQEVAAAADTPLGPLSRNIGFFVFTLGVRNRLPDPEVLIDRIARTLNLGGAVCGEAERIYEVMRREGITAGRRPQAVASAALCLACRRLGISVAVSRVAEAAGVGDVTVRKLVKAAGGLAGIGDKVKTRL